MAAPQPTHDDDLHELDEILVERMKAGDHEAFETIYERYFKRIYHFVERRLSNRADAEETVQEVFISVFSSIEGYRGEAPFGAWIFGVTRRTIASRFKRKRHPTVSISDEDSDRFGSEGAAAIAAEPSPIESYEAHERIDSIGRRMQSRLTPEQRTLFELHHLEDLPITEIARSMNKSEDSIKSNLYRTRKILLAR